MKLSKIRSFTLLATICMLLSANSPLYAQARPTGSMAIDKEMMVVDILYSGFGGKEGVVIYKNVEDLEPQLIQFKPSKDEYETITEQGRVISSTFNSLSMEGWRIQEVMERKENFQRYLFVRP